MVALDDDTALQLRKGFWGWNALDLHPIRPPMSTRRMQESLVQFRFIAQQQQPLGIGVEPANRVHVGRETELGEGAVRRAVRGELGQHAVGFVKRNQHRAQKMREHDSAWEG